VRLSEVVFLTTLVLATGAISACGSAPASLNQLNYGLTLVPTNIDPQVGASSELGIPLRSVYDTLVFRDAHGQFVPGLASRWEVSADGLTYTFFLRQDVRFQDGTPFNAEAVRINLERVLDPAIQSQKAAFMLGPLQSVEVIDPYTVRLHMKQPFAPLLDSLSQVYLGMASPAALAKWGNADYQFHQVGTGPFRFVEYLAGDHLTLERNPDYAWGPSTYQHRTAQVQQIVFRFYEDPASRVPALLSGEADVMGEVPPQDAAALSKKPGYSLLPTSIPGQPLQFFLNVTAPPTDDLQVRQALLEATDRGAIANSLFGGSSPPAQGPLDLSTWGAFPTIPLSLYHPDGSAQLLDQAGWRLPPGGGLRNKNGVPLELEIVAPPWGFSPQAAEALQAQWQSVGIAVHVTQVASITELSAAQAGGKYNLIADNFSDTDPDILRSFYSSGALDNLSKVQDAQLDRLLEQAASTLSASAREALYAQAEKRIADLALVIPVRDYVNLNMTRSPVKDLHFDYAGWFPILIDVSK